ncbi:MAG: hypothetical protein QNK11_04915 [Legionella sp.]|nr:hypothetical protein [Legionella sp.]
MRLIFIGLIILVLAWWFEPLIVSKILCGNDRYLKITDNEFCVPPTYAIYMRTNGGFSLFLPNTSSLDSSEHQVILSIPQVELVEQIKGYIPKRNVVGGIVDNLIFLASFLPEKAVNEYPYRARYMKDKLYGQGDWERDQRIVVPIDHTPGWFRIHYSYLETKPDLWKNSWSVVSDNPIPENKPHNKPEFWVGSCRLKSQMQLDYPRRCLTNYLDVEHGVLVNIKVAEENLVIRDKIGVYFIEKLMSWKI